jgi:hypothetical protein
MESLRPTPRQQMPPLGDVGQLPIRVVAVVLAGTQRGERTGRKGNNLWRNAEAGVGSRSEGPGGAHAAEYLPVGRNGAPR